MQSPIPFHILSKSTGASCNLACQYCYYPQESHPKGIMPDELLERFIRQYIHQHPKHSRVIDFVWQGGEPLLAGIGFYQKVVALQKRYAPPNVVINNSLQTNGTLLNDEWCLFLKQYQFVIGISLDGPAILNDQHRVDKQGNGTYHKTVAGIQLLQKHQLDFNVLVVVHNRMVSFAEEVYDHLIALGAKYLQFQPLTQGGRAGNHYKLSEQNWGDFLCRIYQHWQQKNDRGKIFILNIENAYAQYFTEFSPTCVHSKVCGNQLALETDGEIYACDHLIESKYHLGNLYDGHNLTELLMKSVAMPFGQQKSSRDECQTCEVKILCEGGCPAHLDAKGKNELCQGYYQFFSLLLKELRGFSRNAQGVNLWRALNK